MIAFAALVVAAFLCGLSTPLLLVDDLRAHLPAGRSPATVGAGAGAARFGRPADAETVPPDGEPARVGR
jgi:hypothetical protein